MGNQREGGESMRIQDLDEGVKEGFVIFVDWRRGIDPSGSRHWQVHEFTDITEERVYHRGAE